MKVRKILMLGLLATSLFASCSSDDSTSNNGGAVGVKGNAYLSLNISGAQSPANTRTAGGDKTDGTKGESKITTLYVYLVNPDTKKVVWATSIPNDQLTPNDQSGSASYTSKPIKVEVDGSTIIFSKQYDVYLVANKNINVNVGATWDPTNLTTVLSTSKSGSINEFATISKDSTDGTFAMFNESEAPGDASAKVAIENNNNQNNPAVVTEQDGGPVKLDRLVAKVSSAASPDGIKINKTVPKDTVTHQDIITKVSFDGFTLLNGANKTYLQQNWSGSAAPYLFNTVDSKTQTFYEVFDDFATRIPDTNAGDAAKVIVDIKPNIPFTVKPFYCLENNTGQTNAEDLEGNTTGVIYKIQVTDPNSDKAAGDNCFYGYNGEYFNSLKDIQTKYPHVFDGAKPTKGQSNLDAATAELKADVTANKIGNFRGHYDIKVYESGLMYYTYYISDENYKNVGGADATAKAKQLRAILRNTTYALTVKSITQMGDDVPGGWNPDPVNPIDNKDYYIQVSVSVNPWVLSNTDINL
ncbi:MAG: Mfa1 family fimbria major subunit [Prevotella sp.]|jgi:hypothetical protein|nr:Mfa1 family fimbria major subunit [Prevotella sp.]MCH3995327.1 Mfa1 family fimbria major subunit [Prevotella sp.]